MADVVSYILISQPDDRNAVKEHSIIDEFGLELQHEEDDETDGLSSLRFGITSSLEEKPNLESPCRTLSSDFPKSVVTLCEVEERFDQVEHLRSVVYIRGQQAGEIEHGYILNVGS